MDLFDAKPYQCWMCGKRATYLWHIRKHLTGLRKYGGHEARGEATPHPFQMR